LYSGETSNFLKILFFFGGENVGVLEEVEQRRWSLCGEWNRKVFLVCTFGVGISHHQRHSLWTPPQIDCQVAVRNRQVHDTSPK